MQSLSHCYSILENGHLSVWPLPGKVQQLCLKALFFAKFSLQLFFPKTYILQQQKNAQIYCWLCHNQPTFLVFQSVWGVWFQCLRTGSAVEFHISIRFKTFHLSWTTLTSGPEAAPGASRSKRTGKVKRSNFWCAQKVQGSAKKKHQKKHQESWNVLSVSCEPCVSFQPRAAFWAATFSPAIVKLLCVWKRERVTFPTGHCGKSDPAAGESGKTLRMSVDRGCSYHPPTTP